MTSIYAEVDRPGEDSLQKGPQPSVGRQKTSERRLKTEENYCQELFDRKDWKGGKSFVFLIKAQRSDFLRRRFWCLTCWQNDSFQCSPPVSCNWFVNWFIIIIGFIFTREHSVLGCAKKADVSLQQRRLTVYRTCTEVRGGEGGRTGNHYSFPLKRRLRWRPLPKITAGSAHRLCACCMIQTY